MIGDDLGTGDEVNILLVDDRPEGLLTLEAVLSPLKYNLVKARSGSEALKCLLNEDFALILLDVQMPGMDGFETAGVIKKRERSKDIPIIFITAINKDENYVYRGYESGAVDYITKPFDPNILKSKVSVFVDLFKKTQLLKHQAEQLRAAERLDRERALAIFEIESLQRYRNLADAVPQMIWKAQADGTLDYFNRTWCDYTGLTTDQSSGQGWQTVIHPEDLPRFLSEWQRAMLAGKGLEAECRIRHSASQFYRWFLVRATPEKDRLGQITAWLGTNTDIHDRRRSEESQRFLAEVSAVLGASLDYQTELAKVANLSVPHFADCCLVHTLNAEQKMETAAIVHFDKQIASKTIDFDQRYPMNQSLDFGPGKTIRTGQSQLVTELGEEHLRIISSTPEQLEFFKNLGFRSCICVPMRARSQTLGAITFISMKLHYDMEDLEMAEELGRRAGLAVDNACLYREARQAIRARDEFLSIASHELKTPLTPLKIQTQTIMRMAKKGELINLPPEKLNKLLERSDRQVERLTYLIDDMLDISRINIGQVNLKLERFDLAHLVSDVVERFAEQLRTVRCQVVLKCDQETWGTWDLFRIEQVVVNLLTNAMKYGSEKPIHIHVEPLEFCARLTITDQGIGISKKDQPRIFERFERAVSAANFGGLGLGLYIVRQILRLHGGEIQVESETGVGSTFTVELPFSVPSQLIQTDLSHRAGSKDVVA